MRWHPNHGSTEAERRDESDAADIIWRRALGLPPLPVPVLAPVLVPVPRVKRAYKPRCDRPRTPAVIANMAAAEIRIAARGKIYRAHFASGKSAAEIAAIMGLSTRSVYMAFSRLGISFANRKTPPQR